MNEFISYLWRYRIFSNHTLRTTNNEVLEILNSGIECCNDTNMFEGAIVKIGGKTWAGNIILDITASEWEKRLQKNKDEYKNVILHIVENRDIEILYRHGESIPQLVLNDTSKQRERFLLLKEGKNNYPCAEIIPQASPIFLNSYMSDLLIQRIEEKGKRVFDSLEKSEKDWTEAFLKTIIRNFGFGIKGDAFEKWANILNFKAIKKHSDNQLQTDAMLFGQAGLLNLESIPTYYRAEAEKDEYYLSLCREYKFLSTKFNLHSLDYKTWEHNIGSPPHRRISQISTLLRLEQCNINTFADCTTLTELRNKLSIKGETYWNRRTIFGSTAHEGNNQLKKHHIDLLIINSIIPIFYCYGKHRNNQSLCEKAEDFLHQLPSEDNGIIKRWNSRGLSVCCAADSQAIIQLEKEYCKKGRCLNCRVGYYFIRS